MADHIRKQIRDDIVTTVTGLATTGANVFVSRVYPSEVSDLPCLLVATPGEAIILEDGTLDAPERILTATIRGRAKAVSALDDALDQIANEVEVAMGADITAGGLAHAVDLLSTDMEFDGDGNQPYGEITFTYSIKYRTPFGDPDAVA